MEVLVIKISSISKDLHSKHHSEFEGLFGKEFKPIKTPMSEGYHPEVDNSPLCTEDDSANYRSIICYLFLFLDNCLR
jgi:hypothetical protein